MNLIYNSDVSSQNFGTFDISFDRGNTLESSVLMSIFSWRRVDANELEEGSNRYGWWTDTPERKLGSKLWLLRRKSITPKLMPSFKDYIKESLQWLVEDGICSSVEVSVEQDRTNPDMVKAYVSINKNDGSNHIVKFGTLWNELVQG